MKTNPDKSNEAGKVPAAWAWHYRTLMALHRRLLRDHDEHLHDSSAPADKAHRWNFSPRKALEMS